MEKEKHKLEQRKICRMTVMFNSKCQLVAMKSSLSVDRFGCRKLNFIVVCSCSKKELNLAQFDLSNVPSDTATCVHCYSLSTSSTTKRTTVPVDFD